MNGIIKIERGELAQETVDFIIAMEMQKKAFDDKYNAFKAELLKAMEQGGIVKFECDGLRINYIAEAQREDFDKKQFKTDMPDLYDEYVKFTTVKPSIRIKAEQ